MNMAQHDEGSTETTLVDMSGFQRIYFDTSTWNDITDALDRDILIRLLERRRQIPRASVISVAEILLTPDLNVRDSLCKTVRALCGQQQVLEQPLEIAKAVASAFLQGKRPLLIESAAARSFYDALYDPRNAPVEKVKQWKSDLDSRFENFIQQIRPPVKDAVTNYLSLEFLERQDFLQILGKFPKLQELGLSIDQMCDLCRASNVWRALAATLAYIIHLSASHAPRKKRKNGKSMRRPNGADMWQTVYLGCVQVFVTGDRWMLEAATEVSRLLKWPRCTLHSDEFLNALRELSSTGAVAGTSICSVCGIPGSPARGGHAVVK